MNSEAAVLRSFRMLRITGITCVILAVLGALFNAASFAFFDSAFEDDPRYPHFQVAFWAMSLFCLACYAVLARLGVQLYRLKSRSCYGLTALMGT